jgi:hypothetical protein
MRGTSAAGDRQGCGCGRFPCVRQHATLVTVESRRRGWERCAARALFVTSHALQKHGAVVLMESGSSVDMTEDMQSVCPHFISLVTGTTSARGANAPIPSKAQVQQLEPMRQLGYRGTVALEGAGLGSRCPLSSLKTAGL